MQVLSFDESILQVHIVRYWQFDAQSHISKLEEETKAFII